MEADAKTTATRDQNGITLTKIVMNIKKTCLLGIGILNVALLGSQASSIDPAFLPPVGGPTVPTWGANQPVNLGLLFTPTANITVNALGFYDTPGVTAGETVAIFDAASESIVAQSDVALDPTTLADGYYWSSISPVALTAGENYIVDAFTGNNPWSYGGNPVVNPQITYNGQAYN
jgi:hypothetical protein